MKNQKETSHEGITWSEMEKQNIQAKEVYWVREWASWTDVGHVCGATNLRGSKNKACQCYGCAKKKNVSTAKNGRVDGQREDSTFLSSFSSSFVQPAYVKFTTVIVQLIKIIYLRWDHLELILNGF